MSLSSTHLSLREAAAAVGYNTEAFRRVVARGDVPSTKTPSGRYQIDPADLATWRSSGPVSSDESVRDWARRVAATAPALSPAQVRIVADTICGDLNRGLRGVAA